MRNEAINEIVYKGYTIKIYQDENPIDPREDDNLGTMLCKHRGYILGDEKESKAMSPEEIMKYVKRDDVIALPLYLLDHSGLWMRTGRFECDSQGWDTSHVGYITITYEKIRKEYGWKQITKKRRMKIEGYLEDEVKTYSDYLEGNVVGYVIEGLSENEFDSCWGFYPEHRHPSYGEHVGGDLFEREFGYMLNECRATIDSDIEKQSKEEAIRNTENRRIENIQENVTHA